jgi:hypothetical protein
MPDVTLDVLPPPARAIASAIRDGVAAAVAGDAAPFGDAVGRLALADPAHVRVVLGGVVRPLLEELHPDGVDADDVRALTEETIRSVAAWWPALDPGTLIVVIAGALGVHEDAVPTPEDDSWPQAEPAPRPTADEITQHALLLVAALLASRGRPLRPYLERSFTELATAETVEEP